MFISGVICDRCEKDEIWCGRKHKHIITQYLRAEGWSVGKQTLCPSCRKMKIDKNVADGIDELNDAGNLQNQYRPIK